ncbi:MAG: DeoR family transcriptional regulator [Candidatus Levybacteria bacterium]|nr:DeoR family transcriptional regulator [Candidatus Levybacteria bacterium]
MLNISYNVSPRLNEYLDKIEDLRKQILLAPISQALELRLRWEAVLNRTHYSLKLAGNPMKKTDMLKLLSEVTHKKTNDDQRIAIRYKEALDYISRIWQGSPNAVDARAIIDLHRIIGSGRLRVPQAGLQYLLDYLQARIENPIIQAAIVNIEMEKMQLFAEHNSLIAHLAADLFLYKYGYDSKGFLAYEQSWMEDEKVFRENRQRALSSVSLTLWLEYFAENILSQLESIILSIDKPKAGAAEMRESFWQLNERQKSMLNLLDSPQTTITNRQIQKKYKISQITASRDLAKLTNLGLLFSHGKGRSVYYTKI